MAIILSFEEFLETRRSLTERLYLRSGAQRWRLERVAFAHALFRSLEARNTAGAIADEAGLSDFLASLHIEDLALAAACLEGSDDAWRHLVSTHGGAVENFARGLVHDSRRARDIAESLWADLYGLGDARGKRTSPLTRYHGRSALKSWLHAVVVRRVADALRAERPSAPLDAAENRIDGTAIDMAPDPDRASLLPALSAALHQSIAALDANDRLRLSYYYVQSLTLAEIATLLGEHESTVSRNIARVRARIRRDVERALSLSVHGQEPAEISALPAFARQSETAFRVLAHDGGGTMKTLGHDRSIDEQVLVLVFGDKWEDQVALFGRGIARVSPAPSKPAGE